MGLKLYLHYVSQPCRVVGIFCKMNNIDYEDVFVDLFAREYHSINIMVNARSHNIIHIYCWEIDH